ncbi:MAG: MFS transporter, partial [Gemmatimonadales bacterium]
VAFMAVGLPGFPCALLAAGLKDPTRVLEKVSIRRYLRKVEMGLSSVGSMFVPLLVGAAAGGISAIALDQYFGADSALDVAALSIGIAAGLAVNILQWVRRIQRDRADETPFGGDIGGAFEEMLGAFRVVLRTPTLVYIFIGGALISFGMNGIVGWGPTFISRELNLTPGEAAALLGKWGFIFGTAGTLAGGFIADWLQRYTLRSRILTVSAGFLIGGPITIWLLLIRDLSLFVPVACAAFFFLSWYNGPIAAVIFDVVPMRISATVAGAYLLFIHLAGDAIAFPLIGTLSDLFGLDKAVLLLPIVAIAGGVVVLGGARTIIPDMARMGETVEIQTGKR